MMFPPDVHEDHPNNSNNINSSTSSLESSNHASTSSNNNYFPKVKMTNENSTNDDNDDDHPHHRRPPPELTSSLNVSNTDPKQVMIGRRPRDESTPVSQQEESQQPQPQNVPRQCGPHPSQIRVSSPNIIINNNNSSNNNASSKTATTSYNHSSTQPSKAVQKPVVLCLQSSPLRNKAQSNNEFLIHRHHNTLMSDTPNSHTTIVPSVTNSASPKTTAPVLPSSLLRHSQNASSMTQQRRTTVHLPPTPTSQQQQQPQPQSQQLLPFLYTSPLNSLQQLLSIPSMSVPTTTAATTPPPPQQSNQDCDYDESPTELYQLIEQKQWSRLLQKLDEAEENDNDVDDDDGHLESNKNNNNHRNNIRRQASMWMVRKEVDGRLLWRILPLHAAIIFRAPPTVIEALLQCDTLSARQKDDRGMLPLHLAMKNFNLQYNQNQNHIGSYHHSTSTTESSSTPFIPLVDTMTTLWRTVEELLTAYPSGIFSRDRKGRTPLQLGIQTVKKNYQKMNNNNNINYYNNGSSRPSMALQQQQQQQQQQQEMMLAALSVLERYETIYSSAMGDRINTVTATVTRVQHPPPSSLSLPSLPLPPPPPPQKQDISSMTFPPPSIDKGVAEEKGKDATNLHHHSTTILSIQQQHLETLQTLRTMFQKQRDEDLVQYQKQQDTIQQQLDDSHHRERQLQIELDTVRLQLQELQQQQHSSGNHNGHSTESSQENNEPR